jgi:predicted AAA+ superfamily ATPase
MVLLAGPRQVGKTSLALSLLTPANEENPAYLNWDDPQSKSRILRGQFPERAPLIVLDEIHRYSKWRTLTKGFYDKNHSKRSFLITGSARLDYFQRGGDSQLGRSWSYRLHPYSIREYKKKPAAADLQSLLKFGGFPEPLAKLDETFHRRWHRERMRRVIQGDLRELELVQEIGLLELLAHTLPAKIGSPLSVQSLREDLGVAHATVEKWLKMLERMFVCFRIPPFGSPKIRAVKKEQKLYLWDWSSIEDPGARFENLVASQLLKYCHWLEDTQGFSMDLRYMRDTDKREVDFVVLKNQHPLFAVECKSGEKSIAPSLRYFKKRTKIPRFYQVHLGKSDFGDSELDVRVLPWLQFCEELEMP